MQVTNTPDSSNITRFGWTEGDNLYIQFKKGPVYRYFGVPEEVYHNMSTADSAGKFFSAYVRGDYVNSELPAHEAAGLTWCIEE